MAVWETTITELTGSPQYVRRYNGSGFDAYDVEAGTILGSAAEMMATSAQLMYFGNDAKFFSLGYYYHTPGDYVSLVWEYWNGSAWVVFAPSHDSTEGFAQHGLIAWRDQLVSNWAATTVSGQNAFWVRVSAGTVNTAARFYNLLRNLTLLHSTKLTPEIPDLTFHDVNGGVRDIDAAYTGPRALSIDVIPVSLTGSEARSMWKAHLLSAWKEERRLLRIQDRATTLIPDLDADSVYSDFTGKLINLPSGFASVAKMSGAGGITLEFRLSSATRALEL